MDIPKYVHMGSGHMVILVWTYWFLPHGYSLNAPEPRTILDPWQLRSDPRGTGSAVLGKSGHESGLNPNGDLFERGAGPKDAQSLLHVSMSIVHIGIY